MKFSLKEFFIHEGGNFNAKSSVNMGSSHASSHSSGASSSGGRSSTNVQVNIGESHDPATCEGCDECGMHEKKKNESNEFQLKANIYEALVERQSIVKTKNVGATAWSSPSQPVTVKRFFNKDGNLDIDLSEGADVNDDDFSFDLSPEDQERIEQELLAARDQYKQGKKKGKASKSEPQLPQLIKPESEPFPSVSPTSDEFNQFVGSRGPDAANSTGIENLQYDYPEIIDMIQSDGIVDVEDLTKFGRSFIVDDGKLFMDTFEGDLKEYVPGTGFVYVDPVKRSEYDSQEF